MKVKALSSTLADNLIISVGFLQYSYSNYGNTVDLAALQNE